MDWRVRCPVVVNRVVTRPHTSGVSPRRAAQVTVPAHPAAGTAASLRSRVSDEIAAPGRHTRRQTRADFPIMQVAAEINLGTRSVLEYMLSPVQKAWHEAGRER